MLGRTVHNQEKLQSDEAKGLINVVSDYAYALDTLNKYDYQQLNIEQTTSENKFLATYENAMQTIGELKNKFGSGSLFENEKELIIHITMKKINKNTAPIGKSLFHLLHINQTL